MRMFGDRRRRRSPSIYNLLAALRQRDTEQRMASAVTERWRQRLREAVKASGLKYSVISYDTGLTPETISRVLTATHQRPSLVTVTKIAHSVGTSVGWLLGEEAFPFSQADIRTIRAFVRFLEELARVSALSPGPLTFASVLSSFVRR
jgi:transcriptional regulator with XRE-family HTH domain